MHIQSNLVAAEARQRPACKAFKPATQWWGGAALAGSRGAVMKPCLVVRAGILAQHPHGRAKPSDAPVADHQPGLRRLLQRQPASSVWQGRRVSQSVSQGSQHATQCCRRRARVRGTAGRDTNRQLSYSRHRSVPRWIARAPLSRTCQYRTRQPASLQCLAAELFFAVTSSCFRIAP